MPTDPLLEIEGLHVALGDTHALRGVDLHVGRREILGVIGETGSGKTTLVRSIVGLTNPTAGSIRLDGDELTGLGHGRRRRRFRRSGRVQLVFQDPLRSLDPALVVEDLVTEGLSIRGRTTAQERRDAATRALALVGLDPSLLGRVPRDLSGGQRQRVSIARALVSDPELVLFDEPVSALDASSRGEVLRMLAGLRDELGAALLIISHDLTSMVGVVDRVAVLYEGVVVESGLTDEVLSDPQHEYTRLLLAAAPATVRERLAARRDAAAAQANGAAPASTPSVTQASATTPGREAIHAGVRA
ncbi:MAG: ATP-binding cassette domain-containing protein [Solirubrobacteraceae bacterium]|nr:ATP-binding cassette domain-containing protein [Patulibacter sp.]